MQIVPQRGGEKGLEENRLRRDALKTRGVILKYGKRKEKNRGEGKPQMVSCVAGKERLGAGRTHGRSTAGPHLLGGNETCSQRRIHVGYYGRWRSLVLLNLKGGRGGGSRETEKNVSPSQEENYQKQLMEKKEVKPTSVRNLVILEFWVRGGEKKVQMVHNCRRGCPSWVCERSVIEQLQGGSWP